MGNFCCQDSTVSHQIILPQHVSFTNKTGLANEGNCDQVDDENEHTQSTDEKFYNDTPKSKTLTSPKVKLIVEQTKNPSQQHTSINRKEKKLEIDSDIKEHQTIANKSFHRHIFQDGTCYEGEWQNNKQQGRGKLMYTNGDYYEGQWISGKANGYGKYVSVSGYIYEGNWVNDKQQGEGIQKYDNKTLYKGHFHEGRKHGIGKLEMQGGNYYGEFKDSQFHGEGKYVWQHQYYDGQWQNSQMQGKGVCEWIDGKKYIGQYKHGKKNGYGEFSWPDGKIYKGQWVDGKWTNGILISAAGHAKRICEANVQN